MFLIVCIRKCTVLLLTLILFFAMGSVVYANGDAKTQDAEVGAIGVQWVNTDSVKADLSFDGGRGLCGAMVIGKSGTTRISSTVVLARKNTNGTYTTVKTWSNLEAIGSDAFDKTRMYHRLPTG